MTTKRVLIIDDDPAHRLLIKQGVKRGLPHGEITLGASVAEGRKLLDAAITKNTPFELIVIDLRLGAESGLDIVTYALKLPTPPSRIIVVSTSELEADRASAFDAGAHLFLSKGGEFVSKLAEACCVGVRVRDA